MTNSEAVSLLMNSQYYKQGYKQGVSNVLDKIRIEIEQLRLHKAQFLTNDNKVCIDSQNVLNILDKYRAESEGEE